MRIGIDVGGTNTDAVLIDGKNVLATCKTPTTNDIEQGIVQAMEHVLETSGVKANHIKTVMIGTTHFTNAFVERKNLLPVAVIRIALPATAGVPPLIDWPVQLLDAISRHIFLVQGGYQYDGRINSELDERAVHDAAQQCRSAGIESIAICGMFSPVNAAMEERAEEIVRDVIPDVSITLSSRIGRIGLLARENAAIINASLAGLAPNVVQSFRHALDHLHITVPFYISQNDGTLMKAEFVEKYPVLTFSSGPTNSMRGAAYLSGANNAIVVDIGGTTTDIGMLVNGFPRESSIYADIGGVRTNIRMPDVLSLGLGGGSIVEDEKALRIGPQSVGYRITEKAHVFGGDVLTTTDIAVAAGYAEIGDAARVADLDNDLVDRAVSMIHRIIEDHIDRMKINANPVPLILVGGGAILIQREIAGISELIVPDHASVANAIGASISQVGGEVDRVYSYEELGRDKAIEDAKVTASNAAIEAGAAPQSITIVDIEEIPLAYVPGGTVRLRVKAVGDLLISTAPG